MYPKVFEDFMAATSEFGDLSALPTRAFVEPMEVGEEVDLSFGQGVNVNVKLIGLGDLDEATATRECFFEVNGFPLSVHSGGSSVWVAVFWLGISRMNP